jgi:hypothetical protein
LVILQQVVDVALLQLDFQPHPGYRTCEFIGRGYRLAAQLK